MSYTVIRFDEREKWDAEVRSMDRRDVYYDVHYCRLYQMRGDGDPYLFVYRQDGTTNKVIYPFLKQEIKSGPLSGFYFDIITPFGYGGPLANTTNPAFIEKFRAAFHEFCVKENIVSEFIRFHPLLQNEKPLQPFLNVKFVREMVFIDLTIEPEEIFRNISKSNRNRIRKARKEGLTHKVLEPEEAAPYLERFLTLYYQTMDRNRASRDYYYPPAYFEQLFTDLAQHVKLAAVFYEEKVVTADLLLCAGDFIHCHLNAGDPDYFSMGSNALLNYETALWGREQGFKYVYLGGGYEKNDSLFKFKLRFNPTGIVHYYIGTCVHNQRVYTQLVQLWEQKHQQAPKPGYFPHYRQ
mgnify:CR=1 FL=1